jgi:arginyl-tRNA synthetase
MIAAQDLFATLRARTIALLREMMPNLAEEHFARVQMEPPRDSAHGDMATNAALVVAKSGRQPPQLLAAELTKRLAALPEVAAATAAGPGFVNLRLHEDVLRGQLPGILLAGDAYGDSTLGRRRRVNVEYVSANPTGPLHVGHCRGAVVGDALASLLAKAGWDVTREYYINDAGAQVQSLAWAAYWRYLEHNAESTDAAGGPWPPERVEAEFGIELEYRGEYLIPVGQAIWQEIGHRFLPVRLAEGDDAAELVPAAAAQGWRVQADWLDWIRGFAVARMMEGIREDLLLLGVHHDIFVSEAELIARGELERAEALLAARDLIYRGVLDPPKGKTPDDWEPREQTLFRATRFGDEVDRPLRKSDGSGTYFANDIANHLHKLERGFAELAHVWGADHGGYVRRMQAATAALSDGKVPIDIVLTQIVRVMKDGQPVRMSKRAGTYVTLRDLLDDVRQKVSSAAEARDTVRFTMLTRKADAQMEFDLDKVVEQSRDNPVFYVQYAHARCRSVLRQAGDPSVETLAAAPLSPLTDPAELALIRRLIAWPRTVEAAALAREPHRISFFLHDLAADFHVLWNKGRDDATLRFIRGDEPVPTQARLALVASTASVIRSGLAVMGVMPVEEMR